ASRDPQLTDEGRVLERLSVPMSIPGEAELTPSRSNAARRFVSAAAATLEGSEYSFVRISPTGAAPVVSNRLFVARAAAPVVLEHEPNNDQAQAQVVALPCDISGTF